MVEEKTFEEKKVEQKKVEEKERFMAKFKNKVQPKKEEQKDMVDPKVGSMVETDEHKSVKEEPIISNKMVDPPANPMTDDKDTLKMKNDKNLKVMRRDSIIAQRPAGAKKYF